jgi:hypothetical protein
MVVFPEPLRPVKKMEKPRLSRGGDTSCSHRSKDTHNQVRHKRKEAQGTESVGIPRFRGRGGGETRHAHEES